MKRIFCLLCALMLALCPACALAASSVIEPTEDFYVNDQANVLTEETEGLIVLNNDKLYAACGAQIVFVTVPTTGTASIEEDLSYYSIAYMEDRALREGSDVMEYLE